jgi:hypothetical protein
MDQTAKRRSLRRSAGKWNRYEPAASDAELDAIGSPCNKGRSFRHHIAAVARVSPQHHDVEGHSPSGRRSLAMLARKRMESITTRLPRGPRSSRLGAVTDQNRHGYLRSHARVFPLRLDNGGCSPAVPASRGRTKQELTTPCHGAAKQHGRNLMRSRSDLCRKR